MGLESTISYESDAGTWTFYFPTVTSTRAVVPSPWSNVATSTKMMYTIRAVLLADDEADLEAKKAQARAILEVVGGRFLWNKNGTDVVKHDRDSDANFGPHPVSLTFDRYFSTNSALITWQLETEESHNPDLEVMDWAYSITHSIDKNLYTIRTISGILKLNGAKFTPGVDFGGADAYRLSVNKWVCACPDGWQRTQQSFDTSADGLTLTFHLVDEQQYATLPDNCTDGNASLSVNGNPRYGTKKDFILEGWFESAPDEPYAAREGFVALASNLFSYKIDSEAFRVKQLSLRQDLYRPRLSFTMVWDAFPPNNGVPGDTTASKMANWMLALMTKADNWLNDFKGKAATSRGPYGTTEVLGHCGSAEIAPIVDLPAVVADHAATTGGGTSTEATVATKDLGTYSPDEGFFYEFKQSFSYIVDEHIKIIQFKDPSKDDAAQQIFAPQVWVKVAGHISSQTQPPKIPPPPYKPADAYLLKRKIVTEEPKTGPEFNVSWMYLMKLKAHAVPDHIKFGFTPFIDNSGDFFDSSDDPTNTDFPNKDFKDFPTFDNEF